MTLVAAHQPDFLPYTGFWHKMVKVDRFILLPWDQFQKHGYQRRVKMRGSWCSLPLEGKPSLIPIVDVKVRSGWSGQVVDVVRGRYTAAPFWKSRGRTVCELIQDCERPGGQSLAQVNSSLIWMMKMYLGITTDLTVTSPLIEESGAERVLAHVRHRQGTRYLSGTGAKVYMPDAESLFAENGVSLEWSNHQPSSEDSILTAIFDEEDPMTVIMRSTDE